MISYIQHKNIDKHKWDACIDACSNPVIFVYSWYLDVVCSNWDAIVLGDYEAVFPLSKKSKYKISYIYQPFFTRYFGLYSSINLSEKLVTDFLDAIPEKFKYIQLCLHQNNLSSSKGFSISEKKYQALDLNNSYEVLYKNYSDNAKRNIKKALNAGFVLKKNIQPDLVVNLFKTTKGQELEVFKTADYKILLQLMDVCITKNKAQSLAVFDRNNDLCSAGFFMESSNCFVFLKSGVTNQGKSLGAMHLLFDSFIKEHAKSQKMLDFGGSSVDSVARFYKNFGAKDFVYLQVKKNSLPRIVKWISRKS